MTSKAIIETIAFRGKDGVSDGALLTAAEDLASYVEACDGYVSRTLYKDAGGTWREQYVWRDTEAARAADAGFMARPEAQALLALIDRASLEMDHHSAAIARVAVPRAA